MPSGFCFVEHLLGSLFQSGLHIYIINTYSYFDFFPLKVERPRRLTGQRSGADDRRKPRAERGDSEDGGAVLRPGGVTLQTSLGAQ